MAVLNEIIACYGDNHYKIPHLGKMLLMDKKGVLPQTIAVVKDSEDILEELKDSFRDFTLIYLV
jgi:cytochrome oxidase Cu insertion factor (SCO1/SenC/PrrC family)